MLGMEKGRRGGGGWRRCRSPLLGMLRQEGGEWSGDEEGGEAS